MATFNPASGFSQGSVIDGALYTLPPGLTPRMKTATNNRGRGVVTGIQKGAKNISRFSQIDALITSLDATYEQLSNQADWISYAVAIAGDWDLCANCNPGSSGKKLFRQYNFNRELLGLAWVTAPIDPTEAAHASFVEVHLSDSLNEVVVFGLGSLPDTWYIFQFGNLLNNPALLIPAPGTGLVASPGSPWYDETAPFFSPTGTTTFWPACTSADSGAPGLRVTVPFVHDP